MHSSSKFNTGLLTADIFAVILSTFLIFGGIFNSVKSWAFVTLWLLLVFIFLLYKKGFYTKTSYKLKDVYFLFETVLSASVISGFPVIISNYFFYLIVLLLFNALFIFMLLLIIRIAAQCFTKIKREPHNVLIVGAGQDGKLIAEEIQSRPELGMRVAGFLDDNMNTIEEEDSSIPILGLTYDSEAVIKDNNVDTVIIAVKSRMDSNILTDLAKGIPLGVKVWRMPTIYAHITKKLFTSKMAVNWLFYDFVRPKYIMYSHIKRVLDIIVSILLLIITSPISLIASVMIKLTDFGPIFYTQTRIGRFGRPFKMVKFRTMYHDKVDEGFDDDLEEIKNDDKRIMPMCKWIRNFHVDDIPEMLNIIKGDMSMIGPRPVREEVYIENKDNIPFWACRNWVRPGITGWQQVKSEDCIPEERLGYDLYYVKHRNLLWEISIFLRYLIKIFTGKCF